MWSRGVGPVWGPPAPDDADGADGAPDDADDADDEPALPGAGTGPEVPAGAPGAPGVAAGRTAPPGDAEGTGAGAGGLVGSVMGQRSDDVDVAISFSARVKIGGVATAGVILPNHEEGLDVDDDQARLLSDVDWQFASGRQAFAQRDERCAGLLRRGS